MNDSGCRRYNHTHNGVHLQCSRQHVSSNRHQPLDRAGAGPITTTWIAVQDAGNIAPPATVKAQLHGKANY